jgi:hypothetical protein
VSRVIRKSSAYSSTDAARLLGNLFAAELVRPSKYLWLVSPWISNVPILDNEMASYDPLNRWGPRRARLAEVLATLASLGAGLVIATTADPHNNEFIAQLERRAAELDCSSQVRTVRDSSNLLHEKAITGDDYAVVGSMNITFNGIYVRQEYLDLRIEEDFVAQARLDARDRYGVPS